MAQACLNGWDVATKTVDEMNEDAERKFRTDVGAKVKEIATAQGQIAALNQKISKLKEELKGMSFTPVKAEDLLS